MLDLEGQTLVSKDWDQEQELPHFGFLNYKLKSTQIKYALYI